MFSLQTKAAEENNGGPRKMPAAGQDAVANFESTGPSPPFPSMPPLFHPSMAPSLLTQQQHFPRQMGHGDSPAVGQPQQQPTGTPNFPTAVFSQFFHHLMAQQQRASANPGSGPALQPLPNGGLPPPLTGNFPPPVASSSSSGGNSPFPSPLHQFQHNLFLFQQQQQQQQMQQQSQSPKQQSPPIATMDPVFLQMLLLSAAGGGLPQQQTNISGADEATSSQTTAIARTATVKKLERDSDGNAICPACQRSIGKDSAQWAKHLEEERTQLQLAIQDLKEKALGNAKAHLADAGTRQSPSPAASASTENCSPQQKADRILTRIRDNQRNRIDAKLKGRFFLASLSLSNILKANNAATNQKCEQPPVQGNGHRHGEEEQDTESTGKTEAPAVEEQTKSPFSTFCADGRNGRREDMERKPLCMQCQSHAELLVLNVHSGTAQCLECFEQRKQQLQTRNGGPPTESSMPSNGHPPKATGNGFVTPAPMAKKRVSPFSALELAESNGVGTKERCEHEQQKRPKLEAE